MTNHISKNVGLFGGTSSGLGSAFTLAATELGHSLAEKGFNIIFGGGNTGLMGAVAKAAIKNTGTVTGVLPRGMLDRDDTLFDGANVVFCGNMHQRKEWMYCNSSSFIVLPGGLGTLDEFVEILTWKNLGIHSKKMFLLNVNDYWNPIISMFKQMSEYAFLSESIGEKLVITSTPQELILRLLEESNLINNAVAREGNFNYSDLYHSLSSLCLASEIQSRAAELGFGWASTQQALEKVKEELDELEVEINSDSGNSFMSSEFGDLLFAVINLARHLSIDCQFVLEQAIRKFIARFTMVNQLMSEDGLSMLNTDLDKKMIYWKRAKTLE